MSFDELKKIIKDNFGATKLSDIARELNVSPQVVSNWKSRNQVPYKYVKKLRRRIDALNSEKKIIPENNRARKIFFDDRFSDIDTENDDKTIIESLLAIYSLIRKNIAYLIVIPLLALILTYINLKYYTESVFLSSSKILPASGNSSSSGFKGLAKQFGVGISSEGVNLTSAIMFPEIIKSRRLARSLISNEFVTKRYKTKLPLINILLNNSDKLHQWTEIEKKVATKNLTKLIDVFYASKDSPLLTIEVQSFEPNLSAEILSSIISKLSMILKEFKLAQVLEKKNFISNRIKSAEFDLRVSEDELKVFREKNRKILSSPSLMLEEERLIRDVTVQTQVYITLKSEYEMVQIEEVEKGSMLHILDPPEAPLYRVSPKVLISLITSFVFSLILSFGLILVKDFYQSNKNLIK